VDALKKAGCSKIYTEKVSGGANADRAELAKIPDNVRSGDVLAIWKQDRLGRSPKNLIEIVTPSSLPPDSRAEFEGDSYVVARSIFPTAGPACVRTHRGVSLHVFGGRAGISNRRTPSPPLRLRA